MKRVYLDNDVTTKLDERVLKEMMPYLTEDYGNASGIYDLGKNAKIAIENAREKIAKEIHCSSDEIYFTSGGTESNITAIRGIAYSYRRRGNHIITTRIEHPAVLETCIQLESEGFEVTYIDVDDNGIINIEKLEDAVTDKTILITVMYANNEIGVIQPIKEIGNIARENGIFFHTDAIWAIGNEKIDVKAQKIDSLALSANKFYGPKGIGALYVRKGVKFKRLFVGGIQERNKRAGTENVPAIVGMGKAIELAYMEYDENKERIEELKNYFIEQVKTRISDIKINGDIEARLSGNVNISIVDVDAGELLLKLASKGICVSSGGTFIDDVLEPSHVLLALDMQYELAKSTLKISIGKYNTKEEIEYLLENLTEIVKDLRKDSNKIKESSCKFSGKCSGNCAGCHK